MVQGILERSAKLCAALLKNGELQISDLQIVEQGTCYRPGRSKIRVERELIELKDGQEVVVVHK